jgi:outer membrane lipoprotein SlyB
VQTEPVEKQGASRGKNTAEKIAGGATIGGVIGGILGRGKGAAIGAAIGGAAGVADQGLTHAKQVKIPSETRLEVTLRSPLTVELPPGSMNAR